MVVETGGRIQRCIPMQNEMKGNNLRDLLEYEYRNGNVIDIEEPLSTDLQIPTLASMLEGEKIVTFKKIVGYPDFSIVTGVFSSEKRILSMLRSENEVDFFKTWIRIVDEGPLMDISIDRAMDRQMIIQDVPDLQSIPVLRHFSNDGSKTGNGRYITGGIVAARDPSNSDVVNLSFTRIQLISQNRYAFDAGSHGHLWSYIQKCLKDGSDLEMSVIIGAPPIHYLTAAAFMDDEYRHIQRVFDFNYFRGYRNDVPVPSDAEMVIEAKFVPGEEYDEGPFAEYTGYMGYDSTRNVAEVRSIIMRRNPIYLDIIPSNSMEHINLFSFTRSIKMNHLVSEANPKGHDIRVVWPNYGSRFLAMGYVDPPFPGLAKNVALSAMANDPMWNKIVMINEGRTELNLERMLLNLAETRNFPHSLTIVKDMYTISSDPTAKKDGTNSKLIAITRGYGSRYTTENKTGSFLIRSSRGRVLISHDESYADVNIMVPEIIRTDDMSKVGWMIALNIDCDNDISIEKDRLIIDLRKDIGEVPKTDDYVMSTMSDLARRYA